MKMMRIGLSLPSSGARPQAIRARMVSSIRRRVAPLLHHVVAMNEKVGRRLVRRIPDSLGASPQVASRPSVASARNRSGPPGSPPDRTQRSMRLF
jgi:hypothetical protein